MVSINTMTESEWRADRKRRYDEAEEKRKQAASAKDVKEERRWRASRDNFGRQLTLGRAGLSIAGSKAAETRGRGGAQSRTVRPPSPDDDAEP